MAAILRALGLNTYYGASHILRDVDFSLDEGETLGLMGRNGMGKSTLLRTLLGIVPARSGAITFRGEAVAGVRVFRMAQRGIAYVPEGRGIFANLTVLENLVMAARAGAKGRRDWTLERVLQTFPRLAQRIGHGGQQLSGGEQQMLTIGRALMTNPDVLLLDEATEGLAPKIADEIWAIVRGIRDTGISTVVVDKNYRAVTAVASRCVLLAKGEIIFDGGSATLLSDAALLHRALGV